MPSQQSEPESLQTPPRPPPPSDNLRREAFRNSTTTRTTEDTPIKVGVSSTARRPPTVKAMSDALQKEIEGGIVDQDSKYLQNIFKTEIGDKCIDEFIQRTPYYQEGRWHTIPENPTAEKVLYAPFMELLRHILAYFRYPARGRRVIDTHNVDVVHKDLNRHGSIDRRTKYKTSPDFMIMGSGTEFNTDKNTVSLPISYAHCASPGEIKTERNQIEELNTVQITVYARQCFVEQHHRRFVYSIILTEKRARLFMFDRSGLIRSGWINIHKEPKTFIRVLLGFCSPNQYQLGFDTNVFWRDHSRYIRLNNHWEEKGLGTREYHIVDAFPIAFSRNSLRGRGTVCWNVKDSDGTPLLIKDSWRSAGREPESKLLLEVAGVDGVGQMVAYQDDGQDDIASFRRVDGCDLSESLKHNRIFSRIAMEAYGKPLEYFQSRRHLLLAFRDAVNGHRNLWQKKHILHRDISLSNILHGKEGSGAGNRGVLIDLDMAIRLQRETSLIGTFRTGTRSFQSINVLQSERYGEHARPHDYLDDLESFFYVLSWICNTYTGPNQLVEDEPRVLANWDSPDLIAAASVKTKFLMYPTTDITSYFQCLSGMLKKMASFLFKHATKKEEECVNKEPKKPILSLLEDSNEKYDTFLGFIDNAIDNLEPEDDDPPIPPPSATSQPEPITPPHSSHSQDTPIHAVNTPRTPGSARKRRTEGIDDSPTSGKRNKISTGP